MSKNSDTVYGMSQIVLAAVNRLVKKKASVAEVKAVIAGINSVQSGLALRQEQARLSGARVNGDVIMDLKNNPNAKPSRNNIIDIKPAKALRGNVIESKPVKMAATGRRKSA